MRWVAWAPTPAVLTRCVAIPLGTCTAMAADIETTNICALWNEPTLGSDVPKAVHKPRSATRRTVT